MKTKEEKRNQQPSPPTIRTPLPYRNMRHMRGYNKRNGNGKETGMENQRGKDTGYPDNPHSLRPKEAILPCREKETSPNDKKEGGTNLFLPAKRRKPSLPDGKRLFSLPPAEKTANCRSPKRLPSLLPKTVHHFPYCQKNSLPCRRKNNVSLPTAENKITHR